MILGKGYRLKLLKTLVILCLLSLAMIYGEEFSKVNAEISSKEFVYPKASLSYSEVLASINMSRIQDHTEYFGSLGSRVTGYLGCDLAATYIVNILNATAREFPESKLQVSIQDYDLLVPMDRETSVTVIFPMEKRIDAHTLWPNLIHTSPTPPQGIEGPLIYVRDGELREFNDRPIKGSIVLMDFNSGDNWINAAKLGAKAVIFIAPPDTNYYEARKKFLLTPLYLPRLYVSPVDGEYLKELTLSPSLPIVNVKSRMFYEAVVAKNVVAEIPGDANDTVLMAAHYDTWSVVPALAPGADDSTGVSVLLELARFFASHKPRRTIMVAALSGYWEAIAGARAFTEEFFFSEEVVSGRRKILSFVGLDFSTDNSKVAFLMGGHALKIGISDNVLEKPLDDDLVTKYAPMRSSVMDTIRRVEGQLNKDYEVDVAFRSYGWWANIPVPYMLDTEAFMAANGMGFSIRTDDCYRIHWGTPLSTFEKVSFQNLIAQLDIAASTIYDIANTDHLPVDWSVFYPRRVLTTATRYINGFVTVEGMVKTFNYTKGWYDPLPNSLVHLAFKAQNYPFDHVVTKSDQNGRFKIIGVQTSLTTWGGFGQYSHREGYLVEAYMINNETGQIEYAPDQGVYGAQAISFFARADKHPSMVNTVSFKCSPVELYDIGQTERMAADAVYDPRFSDTILAQVLEEFRIFDFGTYSAFLSYASYHFRQEPVAVLFIPPEERFSLTYRLDVNRDVTALLLNTTSSPEGEGFYAPAGEKLVFNAFDYANDLYRLSFHRYNTLRGALVRDAMTELYLGYAQESLSNANDLLQNAKYEEAYARALSALSWSISFYSATFNLINGVAISTIIFFALLVPFILLFERLVFITIGRNRIVSTVSVGLVTIFGFYLLHPGMRVVSNSFISLLGISFEVFFLMVLAFFGDRMVDSLKKYRVSMLGTHFEYSRRRISSTLKMCFGSSIQNMRRRKFRTILTIASLTIVVFSFTALTSVTITMVPRENIVYEGNTPYSGFLIKRSQVVTPDLLLSHRYVDQFFGEPTVKSSIIAKRAWYYPQSYQNQRAEADVKGPSGSTKIKAVIGLTPEEELLNTVHIEEGRWFTEFDYYSCIIPKGIGETIGATLGDTVYWGGIPLQILGMYDSNLLNSIVDIDGMQAAPIRPEDLSMITHSQTARGELLLFLPTSWDNMIIVPYELAVDLGAYVPSVAVKFDNPGVIETIAKDLALNFKVQVYVSHNGTTRIYSRSILFPTMGLEMTIVPLAIGLMVILTTMVGNVHERKSDIFIFSTVGISPSGISFIFIIEAFIYAVVSTLIGFVAGLGTNVLLISYNLLPGFYPNFTTTGELLVIGFSLLFTTLSSLYPSGLASKLATPSLKRKWSIPTSPAGNIWQIPFPFVLRDEKESDALLVYLAEYFRSQTDESLGTFNTRSLELSLSNKELNVNVNLLPVDLHLFQNVRIRVERQEDRFTCNLILERVSGHDSDWKVLNREFVTRLREQFLTWTSLSSGVRRKYMELAASTKP